MENMRFSSLRAAFQDLAPRLAKSLEEIVSAVALMRPEEQLTFELKDKTQPAAPIYHGTSFAGMRGILLQGFKGSFGAGREEMFRKFKEDLPVVYGSYKFDTARWYPLAMKSNDGLCGEIVAQDAPDLFLRIVLSCAYDVEKRRLKIRRGPWNQQEVYLPQDLDVTAITVLATTGCVSLPQENKTTDADAPFVPKGVWREPAEDSSDSDASQLDDNFSAERNLACYAEWAILCLRSKGGDIRPRRLVAQALCEILDIRDAYLRLTKKNSDALLDGDDWARIKSIFLKPLFEAEADPERAAREAISLRLGKRRKLNYSRHNAWLKERFGEKSTIRALLAEPPPLATANWIRDIARSAG